MTIDRVNFNDIDENDVRGLVGQFSETQQMEFKVAMYDAGHRDEFLKDVSALANTAGGHLVIGVAEVDGLASRIRPLTGDSDADLRRLEETSRSGIEPRLPDVRMKAVRIDGGYVLVLRVARSWDPPHRVTPSGQYYLRHSTGVYVPGVQELRQLFTQRSSALDRARLFRDHRIAEIQHGRGDPKLAENGRFVLHVVPVATVPGQQLIDLRTAHAAQTQFAPFSQELGYGARYNYNGLIVERPGRPPGGYTQLFRSGSLEAAAGGLVFEAANRMIGRSIAGYQLERNFFGAYSRYLEALRALNVPAPLVLMVTLSGTHQARYLIQERFDDGVPPFFEYDVLSLPECILEDYGDEIDRHRAIRPAFDALWNAAGFEGAQSFDDEGRWRGVRRR